jgi:hypothetical protein
MLEQNTKPGYARVIGGGYYKNGEYVQTYVKKGTRDELKYWRVIPRYQGTVGAEKKFFASPRRAPGYEVWSKEPYWQEQIRKWEARQKVALFSSKLQRIYE